MGSLYDHLLFVLERDWPNDCESYEAVQNIMAKRCERPDAETYAAEGYDLALAYRDPGEYLLLFQNRI